MTCVSSALACTAVVAEVAARAAGRRPRGFKRCMGHRRRGSRRRRRRRRRLSGPKFLLSLCAAVSNDAVV